MLIDSHRPVASWLLPRTDTPSRRRPRCCTLPGILALAAGACAGIPEAPGPIARPDPPGFELVSFEDQFPEPVAPRPLAPHLNWVPSVPSEGTFAVITLEPDPHGLPVLEATARARDRDVQLYRLDGGAYLGLVAAPLSTEEVTVEFTVTFDDGTQLDRKLTLVIASREFPATQLRVATRFTQPDPASLARIRSERDLVRGTLRRVSAVPLWKGAFLRPLEGVVTSPYGQRRLFNNELRSRHTGLDIDGDTGDPIRASNSGRVVISRDLYFNGNAVFIDHGLGLFTGYFHLSSREVLEGSWVEKGQVIGKVGATGRVTGPHLHWGLYLSGSSLDPSALLQPDFTRMSELLPGSPIWHEKMD